MFLLPLVAFGDVFIDTPVASAERWFPTLSTTQWVGIPFNLATGGTVETVTIKETKAWAAGQPGRVAIYSIPQVPTIPQQLSTTGPLFTQAFTYPTAETSVVISGLSWVVADGSYLVSVEMDSGATETAYVVTDDVSPGVSASINCCTYGVGTWRSFTQQFGITVEGTPGVASNGRLTTAQFEYIGSSDLAITNNEGVSDYDPNGDPGGPADGWPGAFLGTSKVQQIIYEAEIDPPQACTVPRASIVDQGDFTAYMPTASDWQNINPGTSNGCANGTYLRSVFYDSGRNKVYASGHGYYCAHSYSSGFIAECDRNLSLESCTTQTNPLLGIGGLGPEGVSGTDPEWNHKKWTLNIGKVPAAFCSANFDGQNCFWGGGTGTSTEAFQSQGGMFSLYLWRPEAMASAKSVAWNHPYNDAANTDPSKWGQTGGSNLVSKCTCTPVPADLKDVQPGECTTLQVPPCAGWDRASNTHGQQFFVEWPAYGDAVISVGRHGMMEWNQTVLTDPVSTFGAAGIVDNCYGNTATDDCWQDNVNFATGAGYSYPTSKSEMAAPNNQGIHADPYVPVLYLWDVSEVKGVYDGVRSPHGLTPYARIDLRDMLKGARAVGCETDPIFRQDNWRYEITGLVAFQPAGRLHPIVVISEKAGSANGDRAVQHFFEIVLPAAQRITATVKIDLDVSSWRKTVIQSVRSSSWLQSSE